MPPSGRTTQRSSYFLAGQLIGVWVKVGAGAGTLYYAYADQLGNVSAWTSQSGTLETNSLARYDPYGNYRTEPGIIGIPSPRCATESAPRQSPPATSGSR